ncbi:MAG: hypothetical protein M9962_07345 [Oligoflexia bacterium]|nr:hypothetical protein [Oligoflexia bacterium]
MRGLISSSTAKTKAIEIQLKELSESEARKNAFKILGICWLGMLIMLPLPPIHWVSTPGLFIAGIVLFFKKYRERIYLEPLKTVCLECNAEISCKFQAFTPPISLVCPSCRYNFTLAPEEKTAG